MAMAEPTTVVKVINTNAVKGSDVPKTWTDLTSPRFKGRLIAGDPRTVPVNMGLWKILRATYGDSYLKAMAGQNIQWVASLVSGVQTVAAGERDAAMGANLLHMNPLLASAPTAPVSLVHMTGRPIRNAADAAEGNSGLLDLFYFDLLARGVWLAKRGMMALSIALDRTDADRLVGAVEEFTETRAPLFQTLGGMQ